MDYPALRREQLGRFLLENDLDAFLATKVVNVTYLTGFTGDSSYLLVGKDRVLLVSDGRYTEQLHEECPGLALHIRPPAQRITEAAIEVLGKLPFRRIGFESTHLTVGEFEKFKSGLPTIEWKPCEDVIEKLRVKKDASEVSAIREAIGIAEAAFERFCKDLRADDTEKDLGDRIEMYVRSAGGRFGSFEPIISVGARAALPHAPMTGKKVRDGELLLVDWGASGRLYKSDLTRVLATRRISPKLEEVYEVVLRAQSRAIERIRPGVKAQDVDAEARAVFEEAGFGQFFSHGLGHGFGLEIHEAPGLRPNNDTILEAGMVTTVEPGLYFPGWGGVRIEDDLLITADGCERLSSLSRDLRSVLFDA
jgi:Xaa-Pro aminopeptidase